VPVGLAVVEETATAAPAPVSSNAVAAYWAVPVVASVPATARAFLVETNVDSDSAAASWAAPAVSWTAAQAPAFLVAADSTEE
jgi:hypothetical protein